MSDAAKEAFKLGFLTRCAEEGLSGEKLDARLEQLEKVSASDVLSALTTLGVGVPVGLGLAGGGALGWGAAKLMEPKLNDDEIKAQELANTYKVYADRLKARRKLKTYRPSL